MTAEDKNAEKGDEVAEEEEMIREPEASFGLWCPRRRMYRPGRPKVIRESISDLSISKLGR